MDQTQRRIENQPHDFMDFAFSLMDAALQAKRNFVARYEAHDGGGSAKFQLTVMDKVQDQGPAR